MSTPDPILIDPGDGSGGGTYPPVTPAPTPTPTPSPTPTPTPAPSPSGRTSSAVAAVIAAVPSSVIPLSPVPSQTLAVALGGQGCRISVYTRFTGLFLDLLVNDRPIALGVLCADRAPLVRAAYLGFVGEMVFVDTQGEDAPTFDGLGTRFRLLWLGV